MIAMNKDTMMMVAVLACVLAVLYLYREVQKMKKVPVKSVSNHAPVYDTFKSVPAPVYVPTPVQAPVYVAPPVPVVAAPVSLEEK
jgi:F0F1-type ATP synthase membrane subunit a